MITRLAAAGHEACKYKVCVTHGLLFANRLKPHTCARVTPIVLVLACEAFSAMLEYHTHSLNTHTCSHHADVQTHVRIRPRTRPTHNRANMHIYIHTYKRTNKQQTNRQSNTDTNELAHTYPCTNTNANEDAHAHAYTHTRIHAYTHRRPWRVRMLRGALRP